MLIIIFAFAEFKINAKRRIYDGIPVRFDQFPSVVHISSMDDKWRTCTGTCKYNNFFFNYFNPIFFFK